MLTENTKLKKILKNTTLVTLLGLSTFFMGCLETGYGDWGYSGGFSSDYSYRSITNNSNNGENQNNLPERTTKDDSYYGGSTQPYTKYNPTEHGIEK